MQQQKFESQEPEKELVEGQLELGNQNAAPHTEAGAAAADGAVATDVHGNSLVRFDAAIERRIRWKTDLRIVPVAALLYLFCFIDRSNIGNARLAGFEKDLKLKGFDFNTVLSIFYVSYIAFEIPSNLACKYVGPGKWLPFISFMFGAMTVAFSFVRNRGDAIAVRFILGIFEAGMLPGLAYYLSRWYRKAELTFRLALFIVTAPLAGAFGGLLASGILHIDGIGSLHTWQQIFFIEGLVTVGVSGIAYIFLTDSPETAKWLTEEERAVAIARVKSENVGSTEVLDKIDGTKVLRGIWNPNTIAVAFMFAFDSVPANGVAVFAPTIIRTIYPGFSTTHQQLLTVPPYIVGAAVVLGTCLASWKMDKRLVFLIGLAVFIIIGYVMLLASENIKVRYAAVFLLASGVFPYGALTNSQVAANVISDTARSSAIATNVMIGSLGSLAATWSYLPGDAPIYKKGNSANLACAIILMMIGICLAIWELRDNKKRSKIDIDVQFESLTRKEIEDLDWKHPGFRWRY